MVSLTGELLESRCELWISSGNKSVTLRRFRLECDLGIPVSSTSGNKAIISSYSTVELLAMLFRVVRQNDFVLIPILGNLSSTSWSLARELLRTRHDGDTLTYT